MRAKVFLSCGQNKDDPVEMKAVEIIATRLREQFCFDVHVAVNKNFFNGNPSLLEALSDSDYYLFINFNRIVSNSQKECFFSLYTHQELAMALTLGFDKSNMLLFHKKGMEKTGILGNMFINGVFESYSDVTEIVINAVRESQWTSDYSRKLVVESADLNSRTDDWIDEYGNKELRHERIAIAIITNRRNDYAATNCQVHLKKIAGQDLPFDRNPIKATGVKGYVHTIWPRETVGFDLLGYDVDKNSIFMHTQCDVTTPRGCRKPLIETPGDYTLTYEVYAEHFPVSTFDVKLHLGKNKDEIAFSLFQPTQHTYCSTDPTDSFRNYPSTGGEPTGTGALSTSYPNPDI